MGKPQTFKLLREALDEVPRLRTLHYSKPDFNLWRDKVEVILKAWLDKEDLWNFESARPLSVKVGAWADETYQEEYLTQVGRYETALKSIIQKYEILGVADTPAPTDADDPTMLFNHLHFHPRIIEVGKGLFIDGHYAQAIFETFKAVNNFIKEKAGNPVDAKTNRPLDGKDLMAKVFNEKKPIIMLNELKSQSDKDEQEGFMFLFMGAMVGIRNPKAHDSIIQTDPYKTLEYLAFASLLLKRAEEGKLRS